VPAPGKVGHGSDAVEFEITYDGSGAHARLVEGASAGFACLAVGAGEDRS
jgi:hypothetical protein